MAQTNPQETIKTRRLRPEFWALLAVLAAYITILPAIFAGPAEQILFNPQEYKQALAGQGVYSRFPLLLGEMLSSGGNRILPGSGGQLLDTLESSRSDAIVREVFPETWVQAQAESLIDQFWAYFNFQTPQFSLMVDLRPVKEHLSGEDAPQIASLIVAGLPPCTAEDLFGFALKALSGETQGLPLCRPSETFIDLTNALVGGLLQVTAGGMPDEIDLAEGLKLAQLLNGEQVSQGWARVFSIYRFFRQVGPWLPWVALAAIGLVLLAGSRTARGPFFWGGAALILPGVSALMIALLLGIWSVQLIPFLVSQALGNAVLLLDVLVDLMQEIGRRYLGQVLLIGLLVTAVGGVMLILSLRNKKEMG